jgi:hypothetical protein
LDADALSARLSERLDAKVVHDEDEAFSTFLLAAGLYQVFEDYFHREAFVLRRAARLESSARALVPLLARAAGTVAVGVSEARRSTLRARGAARSGLLLRQLVEHVARAAVDPARLRRRSHPSS